LRFGAAGAGMNLEIGIVAVGLAREQAFEFALTGLIAQFGEIGLGLGEDGLVALASASSIRPSVSWSSRSMRR